MSFQRILPYVSNQIQVRVGSSPSKETRHVQCQEQRKMYPNNPAEQ